MGVYLAIACLPFNAIAATLNALLGFFVIQSLSKIIPQLGHKENN
jgi:riboflavin transporter FmnP